MKPIYIAAYHQSVFGKLMGMTVPEIVKLKLEAVGLRGAEPLEVPDALDIVTRESDRLNSIVTDFLIFSREKNYRFAPCDLDHDAANDQCDDDGTDRDSRCQPFGLPEAALHADAERLDTAQYQPAFEG